MIVSKTKRQVLKLGEQLRPKTYFINLGKRQIKILVLEQENFLTGNSKI